MTGLTNTASKRALDTLFPTTSATDYIAYSTDGATEFTGITRTSIGANGWSAATTADPSVKTNSGPLVSGAATTTGTVSHFAVFDAPTAGNQMTDWVSLNGPLTVAVGDQVSWAAGSVTVTLT